MLVYRVSDGNDFITDHLIVSEKMLNDYIDQNAKLYMKKDNEYYLWYDGEKWLFPKPDLVKRVKINKHDSEILSVLQEINSKLDNLI